MDSLLNSWHQFLRNSKKVKVWSALSNGSPAGLLTALMTLSSLTPPTKWIIFLTKLLTLLSPLSKFSQKKKKKSLTLESIPPQNSLVLKSSLKELTSPNLTKMIQNLKSKSTRKSSSTFSNATFLSPNSTPFQVA